MGSQELAGIINYGMDLMHFLTVPLIFVPFILLFPLICFTGAHIREKWAKTGLTIPLMFDKLKKQTNRMEEKVVRGYSVQWADKTKVFTWKPLLLRKR